MHNVLMVETSVKAKCAFHFLKRGFSADELRGF